MFPSYLEVEKLVPSYFEPDKLCCSYLEREKSGSLLFGHQKMQFTTVSYLKKRKSGSLLFGDYKMQFTTISSKKKYYDLYLNSEILVHSYQEHEKKFPSYFKAEKTDSQLF